MFIGKFYEIWWLQVHSEISFHLFLVFIVRTPSARTLVSPELQVIDEISLNKLFWTYTSVNLTKYTFLERSYDYSFNACLFDECFYL